MGHDLNVDPPTPDDILASPTNRSEDYRDTNVEKYPMRRSIEHLGGSAAQPGRGIGWFDRSTRDRRLPELE